MAIFFAVIVPLIFFIITFLVKFLIEGVFNEAQLYLGIELTLGTLSSTITYIYNEINNIVENYKNKTNISTSEVISTLHKNVSIPLVFIVATIFCLIIVILLHRLFQNSTDVRLRRLILLGISNIFGFALYFGYALSFALEHSSK